MVQKKRTFVSQTNAMCTVDIKICGHLRAALIIPLERSVLPSGEERELLAPPFDVTYFKHSNAQILNAAIQKELQSSLVNSIGVESTGMHRNLALFEIPFPKTCPRHIPVRRAILALADVLFRTVRQGRGERGD